MLGISAYLSHYIRGRLGDLATLEDMHANNRKAINMAEVMKVIANYYGIDLDLYVPAAHDEVLNYLYINNHLSIKRLLEADCSIVKRCRVLFVWRPDGAYISPGMQAEIDSAAANRIQIFYFSSPKDFIDRVLELKQKYAVA